MGKKKKWCIIKHKIDTPYATWRAFENDIVSDEFTLRSDSLEHSKFVFKRKHKREKRRNTNHILNSDSDVIKPIRKYSGEEEILVNNTPVLDVVTEVKANSQNQVKSDTINDQSPEPLLEDDQLKINHDMTSNEKQEFSMSPQNLNIIASDI